MNSKVRVRVETPVGRTEAFELTEIVRQGTVCAVDLCGVSTDKINKLRAWGPPLIVSGIFFLKGDNYSVVVQSTMRKAIALKN